MSQRFTVRSDSASNWAAFNPVLAVGEIAWSTDTLEGRMGDGSSPWTALPVVFSVSTTKPSSIINDDAVNVSSSAVWSSLFTQSQLASILQQANAYTDSSGQGAQLAMVDQNSDGTWSARPNAAVVFARGYSQRTDVPFWLTTADQYQARS